MFSTLASTLFRDCHFGLLPQTLDFLRFSGGDDGARTRDLCRDSLPGSRFSTTYNTARATQIRGSRARQRVVWIELWIGSQA
jgi:hypothetical protein